MDEYECFLRGMGQLTANFPPRGGSPESADALLAAWWLVLQEQPWITTAVFERAVRETLTLIRDYLPPVAEFVAVCQLVRDELAREAERTAQRDGLHRVALPAPVVREVPAVPPRSPDRAEWNRQLTIGKAHIRRRHALIDAYRAASNQPRRVGVPPEVWRGKDEPTDAEVAAVLTELARGGGWTGPLGTPLQRASVPPMETVRTAGGRNRLPLPASSRAHPADLEVGRATTDQRRPAAGRSGAPPVAGSRAGTGGGPWLTSSQ